MPATGVVVGLGTAAVATASEFDASMSKVASVSGATGDDFDKLREKAREMGAKTKFSASEAAEAMNYMAMAGWKTEEMLDGIEGIMNLAAAAGEDLGTTSDIVTDALTAFGLSAADSGHFADILAAASSNANTNVAMMGETFKYCAPIAGALGFSAEETAEAIGLMANSGIKSSQAGTALRTIMNNLSGSVEIVGDNLGEVTIQTSNVDGSMRSLNDILNDCRNAFSKLSESEQAANAESLVGKNAMSGFLALMNAGSSDINKLENAINNCDGTASQMALTMQDNLSGQLTILKSQLEELAISFADLMMPTIRKIVSAIQNLVDFLNKLPTPVKEMILTVSLVVAAIGPLLIIIGKTMSAIGTIMSMTPKIVSGVKTIITVIKNLKAFLIASIETIKNISAVGAILSGVVIAVKNFVDMFKNGFSVIKDILMGIGIALAAVGAVILGAPALITGVIAAVVFAVANLVILIKEHFAEIKEFFVNLWGNIKEVSVTAWEGIKETLSTLIGGIVEFFSLIWSSISSTVTTVWNDIYTSVSTTFSNIVEGLVNTWNGFVSIFQPLIDAFKYLFETIFEAIKILVNMAMEAIDKKITEIWNGIVAFLTPILESIKTFFETTWSAISNFISQSLDYISNLISTVWNAIGTFLSGILNSISAEVSSIWNSITTFIGNQMNAISTTINSIWTKIKTDVSTSVSGIANAIRSGFDEAVNYIKGLISQAFNWGKDLIMGIVNGIKSAVGALAGAITGVADNIRSVLHFSVPDEGPLTDYESWMPDFMEGLAKGIEKSKYLVSKAMEGVTTDLMINSSINSDGLALNPISSSSSELSNLFDSINNKLSSINSSGGDILIPVYIGQERIDEIVVSASQRANYRSGGR